MVKTIKTSSHIKLSDVFFVRAPGSNPISHNIWNPLHVPKIKPPAFAYSFAVHVVVLGLCFVLYRAEAKISKERRDDAQSLRFAAYNKAIHQNVTLGTIDINVLSKSGEVYITQNARCIQIQLSKPKGDYILATLENGELKLDPKIVSKYFKDSEVTILVFNGAVEVWSKNTLEKYIEEEVAIRPV